MRREGRRVTIRHRGLANARAALSTAFRRFGSATTVFVTGCSAGSAGAAFHMPAILGRYPRARVTYFGDSLAFVFGRPIDIERDWRGDRVLPPWADVDPRRFTMTRYLAELAHRYPRRTFARFNHAGDAVQERYYLAAGGPPGGFERTLRGAEETLERTAPNYRSFLACGSTTA